MVKEGSSKVSKHPKANTLYISIPSKISVDSSCPIKKGDIVKIIIEDNKIIIKKKEGGDK